MGDTENTPKVRCSLLWFLVVILLLSTGFLYIDRNESVEDFHRVRAQLFAEQREHMEFLRKHWARQEQLKDEIHMSRILFPEGSAELSGEMIEKLRGIAFLIKGLDAPWINLTGSHSKTEPAGGNRANRLLAFERSKAVREKLTALGIPTDVIGVVLQVKVTEDRAVVITTNVEKKTK